MFAAATSFFARTAISQSYNVGTSSNNGSRSSTPGPSSAASSNGPAVLGASINVGLWRVQAASHKVTSKRVSVWSFDKRGSEVERLGPLARERTLEVLKSEASALGRLRHPSILEMVEPLEETRNELIFATEPILSSLELSIPGSGRYTPLVELDEVEIQKGILQLCKGLSFLHSSLNSYIPIFGDWKISGLGLTIPLISPSGSPTRWEFPTFDGRVPSYIQRSFDYMGIPRICLDEALITSSDMYSLGCLIYAVHCRGNSPFKTHGSLGGLREHAGKPPPGMDRLDNDLQALLRSLITRHAHDRPTPSTLPSHPFFSSLPISTLNFLDRSNFTAKTREEKISFMKGLVHVLDKFSDGLRTRKILPSLLEEMKDIHLLPYILPNVFSISVSLSPNQFANMVLPSLKPLFVVKEPPQNMLTLLDNLTMLQEKTEKNVFRQQVLPLVYNALESEHAVVQERALNAVPGLCETIDYAEVHGVIFPRVALVFTQTRILTVKVATLATFLTMVKTLDQTSLTQKLVPLLSKIRTKEPAVMMATLSVQEAMGFKVDREAVATLVLPQLWAMSIGPLLNVEQFQRFMQVIRKLGDRVEKEHDQFLRDSQRLEDRSATATSGSVGMNQSGTVDFESLVGRANGAAVKADTIIDTNKSWDDDASNTQSPSIAPTVQPTNIRVQSLPPSPGFSQPDPSSDRWPKRAQPNSTFNSFVPPQTPKDRPGSISKPLNSPSNLPPPIRPLTTQQPKPNYNLAFAGTYQAPLVPSPPPSMGTFNHVNMLSPQPLTSPSLPTGSFLTPSKPAQPTWNSTQKPSANDWGDFDPLA
ncbi:kinase-like domain-containing protein [Infundibulicybe gibba]|nr:kinase-like domain-containing protein [Infundibulicybe gibba]